MFCLVDLAKAPLPKLIKEPIVPKLLSTPICHSLFPSTSQSISGSSSQFTCAEGCTPCFSLAAFPVALDDIRQRVRIGAYSCFLPGGETSSHSSPRLIQRTSVRGGRVRRFGWEGNSKTLPWGCNVRSAPHSGHSTFVTAVSIRRTGARSRCPTKVHLVGCSSRVLLPTGSRRGARCPGRAGID